jgi:hypothetical protein
MTTLHLDLAYWLGLLTSVVLPVLVGLVTTKVTSAGTKAVILLALSVLNGFLVELGDHGSNWSWGTAAVLALVTFGTGVLTHFGLWKPTGVSAKAQALGTKKTATAAA